MHHAKLIRLSIPHILYCAKSPRQNVPRVGQNANEVNRGCNTKLSEVSITSGEHTPYYSIKRHKNITMNKQQRHEAIANAMELKKFSEDKEKYIIKDNCNEKVKNLLMKLIYDENIGGTSDLSYEICAMACDIIANKTLTGNDRDSLVGDDLDLYADADGTASVYTSTQLSYINNNNESEISAIIKDESHNSIAQACASWYVQMVHQACETLKDYVLND